MTYFPNTSSLIDILPRVENKRIHDIVRLITPRSVKEKAPTSAVTLNQVLKHRRTICKILRGEDPRLLVIVGPCSIHDPISALDYARRLAALAEELNDRLFIVMRVYFEKPRTTIGWKGLVSDPHLNDSGDMTYGILLARQLLLDVAALGLPAATEFWTPSCHNTSLI